MKSTCRTLDIFHQKGLLLIIHAFLYTVIVIGTSTLVHGRYESISPCDPEHYIAPRSKTKIASMKANLNRDVKMAFQSGDKELTLTILCRAAAAKMTEAEKMLGATVMDGYGFFRKNETQARYWFKRAADKGDIFSQYQLSVLYREGRGGPVKAKEGMQLLRSAAYAGVPDALLELAAEHVYGRYVPRDNQRARYWAEKAKRAGSEKADEFLLYLNKHKYK